MTLRGSVDLGTESASGLRLFRDVVLLGDKTVWGTKSIRGQSLCRDPVKDVAAPRLAPPPRAGGGRAGRRGRNVSLGEKLVPTLGVNI